MKPPLSLMFCAFLTAAATLSLGGGPSAATDPFLDDCRKLTESAHRLTGTEESRRAADYIEKRLAEIGVDRVLVQEFPAAQTRVERCEILFPGEGSAAPKTFSLEPVRPNGIIAPVTPPKGISGPLYYAGAGRIEDFGARSPQGCIVILDYNGGTGWLRAFRLGARAVIFVPSGRAQSWQAHYADANANLPRFYYPGDPKDLRDGASATIHSEVVWQRVQGRNIYAFLRGTQPVFQMVKEELLIVAANLDTFGEVPRLSPGARGAANCAGLLKLAEYLKQNRPRRHVLLAFFDGESRGHLGSTVFYRTLDDIPGVKTEDLQKSWDLEKKFLDQMLDLLGRKAPLGVESPVRREMITRLQRQSAEHAYDVGGFLYDLRQAANALEKGSPKRAELDAKIQADQTTKDDWNELRRTLGRASRAFSAFQEEMPPAVKEKFDRVVGEVKGDLRIRMDQLALDGTALKSGRDLKDLIGNYWITLHASLLFGDSTPRWGLIIGGDSDLHSDKDKPGLYGKIQATFLSADRKLEGAPGALRYFEIASADGSLNPQNLLWAAPFLVHSGEVAGKLGIYNLAIGTCQESLAREGTPDDSLANLGVDRIRDQVMGASRLLAGVASEEGLSQPSSIERDKEYFLRTFDTDNRPHGPMVMGKSRGSSMANKPMPNATVQIAFKPLTQFVYQPKKIYAFDNFQVLLTDHNGSYSYGPAQQDPYRATVKGFAAAFDGVGRVIGASTQQSESLVYDRLETFLCRDGLAILPPQITPTLTQILEAAVNSPLDPSKAYLKTVDGIVYWYCGDRVAAIKFFGLGSAVGIVNGPIDLEEAKSKGSPDGVGFPMSSTWQMPSTARRSAADLWRLDEYRMQILRDRNVMNSSIEELHGRTEDWIMQSQTAQPVAQSEALDACAFLCEKTVYDNVRSTLDDLVHAVLVLLALCVPFAFAAERLVIGATSIYRQIMWFVGIFALTFIILFFTHPAFAISKTPIIIFLGFAVVVLSVLVIVIIMRKFEVELKVIQGLTATVHAADVSRVSTILAAMSMGISTMRRRPLRTALTAVTIILLTFTILCFASFGTLTGVIKLFIMPSPAYTGAQVRQVNWSVINPEILDVIKGRWGHQGAVCSRYWISPEDQQKQGLLITREDGAKPLGLRGLLGLDETELRFRNDVAEVLGLGPDGTMAETVWMTQAVADRLQVKPGDAVVLGGVRLKVAQPLEAVKLSMLKDMDDSDILPVDFVEMKSTQTQEAQGQLPPEALQYKQNWAILPTDSVVIVSSRTARLMGATLREINLYTENQQIAVNVAEDLARVLLLPVTATRQDGAYRHVLDATVAASGARDLLFPILLGGLVIFGTMLGSVADREKEIYTFSALGLAPQHVAGLFFSEAMVYSVLGGMGGYLLAQGSMKVLSYLAAFGLVRVPEMNYSSTNAIVTILIVMGTVLVSAIYPAIKASRSANPGVLRSWRLPSPEGDTFHIVFPFTVSEYDITGVVSFLKEHFDNYRDTGLGTFMSKEARLVRTDKGIGLNAHLALAPFDLGVTESFELRSTASEIAGIDEVKIVIQRASGQPKDWQRLNKVLLDDLRRQFLIWRSLAHTTMELYRERTLTEMGRPNG